MKKIFAVFLLSLAQLCFGAASATGEFFVEKVYERSSQNRRDYSALVRTVFGKTKQPFKVTAGKASEYRELLEGKKYKCTFQGCKKPLGMMGRGITKNGYKQHFDKHMGIEFQCISCGQCFKGHAQCYNHVAKCEDAPVPLQRSRTKVKKRSHQAFAGKSRIDSSLVRHIRGERKRKKGHKECLMCSLAVGVYYAFTSFQSLECHRETKTHQDVVAAFMNGKHEYKELQAAHAQLNSELPKDNTLKKKLR